MKTLCITKLIQFFVFILIIFLPNILCDDSLDYYENCGERPRNVRISRIVGGSDTYYGEVPWQVLLHQKVGNAFSQCGAVLIHNKWIITAAHCIQNKGTFQILFGKHMLTDGLTNSDINLNQFSDKKNSSNEVTKLLRKAPNPVIMTRNASKIIVHENFNEKTFENDIALVMLNENVEFEDSIQPICLPKQMEDFSGQTGYVSGFGVIQYGMI
jgi:secreted trypsin-like serine protease